MVKVRGYSVVLGAVDVAVMKHPGVASAVVLAEGDEVTKRIFLRAIIILKMIIFQDRLGTNIGKRVQKRVALSYRPTLERNGSSLTWCAVLFSHLYIYTLFTIYIHVNALLIYKCYCTYLYIFARHSFILHDRLGANIGKAPSFVSALPIRSTFCI